MLSTRGTILFLTSCPLMWGGSEELWAGAALHLHKRGYRIRTGRSDHWSPGPLHSRWQELRRAGIGVNNFKISPLDRAIPDAFYRYFPPSIAMKVFGVRDRRLARKLGRLRPDLVVISQGQTYDGMERFPLASFSQLAGIPYVLVCQKSAETVWPEDKNRDRLKDYFSQARKVFFVSEHNRNITIQQLGIPLDHAEVVRNPYLVTAKGPLPWPAVSDSGTFKLACVARMWPMEKGQDLLLNVLALDKWRSRPLEVNFFGEGPMERGLEEMARWHRLSRVHFRGFSTNITQVWHEHHALVLPSRAEGLPLAQVEAMMCGRPVIVTPAGGSGEILEDGITGFLADAITEQSLDNAMERAWLRRHEWEVIGRQASAAARSLYCDDPCQAFADKLMAIHTAVTSAR